MNKGASWSVEIDVMIANTKNPWLVPVEGTPTCMAEPVRYVEADSDATGEYSWPANAGGPPNYDEANLEQDAEVTRPRLSALWRKVNMKWHRANRQ